LVIRIRVSRVVTARRLGVRKSTASAMGRGINVVSTASVKTVPIVDLFNINFVVSKSTSIRLI
jgi:hypothetical protein